MGEGFKYKGLPFKGSQMIFRKKDPPHLQPQKQMESRCAVFNLWEPEDMQKFNDLLDEVAKQTKIIWKEDKQWIEEKQNWKMLIIWFSAYYTDPAGYRKDVQTI